MKEICICNHLKECHQAHSLDPHGANCSHCSCKEYTWTSFVWTDKEVKDKITQSKSNLHHKEAKA